jgi:hypothetical protein
MSFSITSHERSSSTWVLVVSKMVLNQIKAMSGLVFKTGLNIGLPCSRYCHEEKKIVKESKDKI